MNNLRIDTMHVIAAQIISEKKIKILEQDKIPSRYNGYIASFGPAVSQSTLLQTLAFYSQEGMDNDRQLIINLIEETLKQTAYGNMKTELKDKSLYLYIKEQTNQVGMTTKNYFKELVLDAAVACKLAMKTFPEPEEEKE